MNVMLSDPTIEVHTICWNEETFLPLFLSHYEEFVSRIVVWDNHSDDASADLVRACPQAELRSYHSNDQSSDDRYLDVKNHCWKDSAADWVIVCDVDELIYHPHLRTLLRETDATVLGCDGFNITGSFQTHRPSLDSNLWRGQPARDYCKPAVFRPSVREMRYVHGCHRARPDWPIIPSRVKLLHCQYLRTQDELIQRYRIVHARKSLKDVRRGFGQQYAMSDEGIRARHQNAVDGSYPFSIIDYVRESQTNGAEPGEIAIQLNNADVRPPDGSHCWNGDLVAEIFGEFQEVAISPTGSWLSPQIRGHKHDAALAAALAEFFRDQTVIDFGCGTGFYVQAINQTAQCRGYDGNPNTLQIGGPECHVLDLAHPVDVGVADWVLSLEVGQHIPCCYQPDFVDNLHRHNRQGIVLSWAKPGQGGIGHCNERNPGHVTKKFEALGYRRDHDLEIRFREASQLPWLQNNILVMRPSRL